MPLILSRADVAALFSLDEYIDAVEGAFAAYARGDTLAPALLHVDGNGGEFHVKAGGMRIGDHTYFALKANGGFFGNVARGVPAIQGIIYLADASDGSPLAILDSIHITIQRTGATTAVAAKYLARKDSAVATVCGAGRQGMSQLRALSHTFPLRSVYVWDKSADIASTFAVTMSRELEIDVRTVVDLIDATRRSDIVVTCTPAKKAFIRPEFIRPGTFIAAIGADSPEKQELDPGVLASARVVTDITAQCAIVGELHHALKAGAMKEQDVHAELGDLIVGRKPGRMSAEEITVYDATGSALQDAACAAAIYCKAIATGVGELVRLA